MNESPTPPPPGVFGGGKPSSKSTGWNWLFRLGRRFFPHVHGWETIHTNKWMIPTHQKCRCGAERWKVSDERPIEELQHVGCGNWPRLTYRWEYSDGTYGPWRRMTDNSIYPSNTEARGREPLAHESPAEQTLHESALSMRWRRYRVTAEGCAEIDYQTSVIARQHANVLIAIGYNDVRVIEMHLCPWCDGMGKKVYSEDSHKYILPCHQCRGAGATEVKA